VSAARQIVADTDYTAPFFRSVDNGARDLGKTLQNHVDKADNFLQNRKEKMEQAMDPGQRIDKLKERFQKSVKNLQPSHPQYQDRLNQFLNDKQQHETAISDAFVKHQSDAFRAHRGLIQNGYIEKQHFDGSPNPNYDFKHFYHNTYVHQRPHPWQHLFAPGIPHMNQVRLQQAQQYGTP
jgi:hypothetical protein